MDEIIFKLIIAVAVAAATTIGGIVAKTVTDWLDKQAWINSVSEVQGWIEKAVKSAEMLYPESGSGKTKKEYVEEFVRKTIDLGAALLDDDQINVMIESAVKELRLAEKEG